MTTGTEARKISAALDYLPTVNLALQQHAVPFVFELRLKNESERQIENVTCAFHSVPEIVVPKTFHVAALEAGEEISLTKLDLEVDYAFLATVTDRVAGKLKLEVRDAEGALLAEQAFPLSAFAADQWLGARALPDLLCAFVTPNLEVVAHAMSHVAAELKARTGSSAIDAYQSKDKTRAYAICEAIYKVLHGWGIHYSEPPASFGEPGQRIRFADMIYKHKLGTCLDLTLLFASVMEQCGLHPVILVQTGHAYVGCHLVDYYFPDVPVDDLQTIRKRVDLDEFVVLETTLVTAGATFAEAEAAARTRNLNADEKFLFAVDVVRARYGGVRPLPLKRSLDGIELEAAETAAGVYRDERPRELQEEIALPETAADAPKGRVARWQQKLLDLSLRNRLLNVRDTRQVIPIACPDIVLLEDKIAASETLTLKPLSALVAVEDVAVAAVSESGKALLAEELRKHRLWSPLAEGDLSRRLTALYRQSRSDLEEGGVNTLFLALGFLEWRPSGRDTRTYQAPILLLPVRLTRVSVQSGIMLSRLDEDTIINVTLLEMLRREFELTVPGIDPLPTDEYGVDVQRVMQIFRQTIKSMKGWEVREEARLGHFSFNKFIMWNDLTNRIDSLRQSPLVAHLIDGGGIYDDGIEVFEPSEIEAHLDYGQLFCPSSADSSQLTALKYSELGKSFVLHGPPGTGKSQTITNIIAHNLALGKRVLFVSEKKVALDVVHRRLSAVGLHPFCLELHSNKAGKAEVLKQFSEVLQVADAAEPTDWEAVTAQLALLRNELNGYVASLHNAYPNGVSAYACFSRMIGGTGTYPADWVTQNLLCQSAEELGTWRRLAGELAETHAAVAPEAMAAFAFMGAKEWSPGFEREVRAAAVALEEAAREALQEYGRQAGELGLEDAAATVTRMRQVAELCALLLEAPPVPPEMMSPGLRWTQDMLDEEVANGRRRDALAAELNVFHLERLRALDCDSIQQRIADNGQRFFVTRWLRNRALLKELAGLKKTGAPPLTTRELMVKLSDIREYCAAAAFCERRGEVMEKVLGTLWNGGYPDWDKVQTALRYVEKLYAVVETCCVGHAQLAEACRARLADIVSGAGAQRIGFEKMAAAWTRLAGQGAAVEALCGGVLPSFERPENLGETLVHRARAMQAQLASLRSICLWKARKEAARAAGLEGFAALLESGTVAPAESVAAFEYGVHRAMLDQILTTNLTLRDFFGVAHDNRVKKFCELDSQYQRVTQQMVVARLTAALPRRRRGTCPEGTELGILKRECEKRARHKPVRLLLSQIPNLLPALKPCFLMSPLSVAQYLPAEMSMFDVVVFDEASQIPVWDAVGVTARARQVIVVGDPKQMPPTNFFQKGESDNGEYQEEVAEDLESILDECLAAGVHSTYLNWHYRSRHESLIAFSNHYYYEDRLVTFPSASNAEHLGVKFHFVEGGVYDRRNTRTNEAEARELVRFVVARLQDKATSGMSVGVVTFSQAQKDLIEDLLDQARSEHPELEPFFNDEQEEPLFVKNLENVQGDERDVILFSVGYAPDKEGKFSMNFGPLNRQGGERRLNVAITRAKRQVVVFSSVRGHQIDLARTGAVGAVHLRHFLEYAEQGRHVAGQDVTGGGAGRETLCEEMAAFLRGKGYGVRMGVGNSACRVDLAVMHPEEPERYLLGVECDGERYRQSVMARDRDFLRASVLAGLGWEIYRVWTAEWYHNPAQARQALLERLEAALAKKPPQPKTPPVTERIVAAPTAVAPAAVKRHEEYAEWEAPLKHAQEKFYEPEGEAIVRRQVRAVIAREGPVYEKVLRKRITRHWGFSRAGDSIQRVIAGCLPQDGVVTALSGEKVFWAEGQDPETYTGFRVSGDPERRRGMDEIPPEELANAMREVLMDFHSCEPDTLFRETVKLFGFTAMTAKMKVHLAHGLRWLERAKT